MDTIEAEGAADQWPVGFEKAQHAGHWRHGFSERRSHSLDLGLHTLDKLGAVPSADTQRLHTRPDDAAFNPQRGTLTHRFASITQTPGGPITMWSMFARVPRMRRSCRTGRCQAGW